jgi:hypothetical protein
VVDAPSRADQRVVLARSVHGAPATVLRSIPGGDIVNFSSDGTTIAWLEGQGYDPTTDTFTSLALWSGTYDGTLHAGFVRNLDAHQLGNPAAGAGYFVQNEPASAGGGAQVYAIYRLSDGARAAFDPSPLGINIVEDRPMMVTTEEIVFLVHRSIILRVDARTLTFV